MVRENPHKLEIKERMKELIREGKPRDYVIDTIKDEFKGLVHKNTPYEWWKDIVQEEDIKEWEKENKRAVISLYDHKRKAKKDLYYWTYNRYMKLLLDFETNENENPDLLDEIYKLQDRLNLYLKRVE